MPEQAPGSADALLVARGLTVVLGGRRVVDGVDLEARAGEVLAVLGPNGAGKSTLLRALAGLVSARGEVTLSGSHLLALRPEARARSVAYVPQQSRLDAPLLVAEVVAQGRHAWSRLEARADGARAVAAAMDAVAVTGLSRARFTEISHGERRRILVARALATGARVLLLDEPTAGLDVSHALSLLALLRRLAGEGRALVVVLHQLDEALTFADRALLLQDGARVVEGPVAEVVAPGPVRTVYGVELVAGARIGFEVPRS